VGDVTGVSNILKPILSQVKVNHPLFEIKPEHLISLVKPEESISTKKLMNLKNAVEECSCVHIHPEWNMYSLM